MILCMACTVLRSTGFAVLPEGCVNVSTMTYIGCMNGVGCAHVEVFSNTDRGALSSGGFEDGFVLVSFISCDQFAADLEARGALQLAPEPLTQTIRAHSIIADNVQNVDTIS